VIEREAGRGVPHQQDTLPITVVQQLVEQRANRCCHLAIALPVGERYVDAQRALCVHLLDRRTVERAVVALTQPLVGQPRYLDAREREVDRLHGPGEVRAQHDVEAVVAAAAAELDCVLDAGG
jgi:hypothetical protein